MKKQLFYSMLIVCIFLHVGCNSDAPEFPLLPEPEEHHSNIGLNKADSIAMVEIYKKIGPWGYEWDLRDVITWGGVGIAFDETNNEYRITGFNYYGSFHGEIPDEFKELTELRYLGLGGGTLGGTIPAWIGSFEYLEDLYIGKNLVEGSVPPEIGNLSNLRVLHLVGNHLSGELPKEIGKLKKLERVYIGDTKIGGEIPKEFKDIPKLRILSLADNQFSGRFPVEILNSYCLVDCGHNNITSLPDEIWTMDGIVFPNLQYNMLSGTIPDWVKETELWKIGAGFIQRQKEGYGYTNFQE